MANVSFSQALSAKELVSAANQGVTEAIGTFRSTELQAAFATDNIVGVGVGYLNPDDKTQGAAAVVYVKHGTPDMVIEALRRGVTLTFEGNQVEVPVRVEVSGEFFSTALSTPVETDTSVTEIKASTLLDGEYRKRVRPVPGGYSVGTPDWSGTAGLIVINHPANTQLYICSNNHVLNRDNSNGYTETIQPGGADGGMSITDRIGRLDRFIRLSKTQDNYMDAATSIPLNNNLLDSRYGRNRITVPGHYLQYSVGWRLHKAGRTTEDTFGEVDSVHTDTSVNYGIYGGLGTIMFKDQSIIRQESGPVSLSGDSGSVWLRDGDNYACAVNYAGPNDGSYSVSFPINWFMEAFNCLVALPAQIGTVATPKVEDEGAFTSILTPELRDILRSRLATGQ